MIKASSIKSVFSTIGSHIRVGHSFKTPVGSMPASSGSIVIRSVGSRLYSVCFLIKAPSLPVGGFCVARSYPMSYKSAYRLVCSL